MAGRKRRFFGTADKPIFVDKLESKKNPIKNELRVPNGFLLLSDATSRLQRGMWSKFTYPTPVREAKTPPPVREAKEVRLRRYSIEFGLWRERAGKLLRAGATKGKLTLYVVANNENLSNSGFKTSPLPNQFELLPISVELIQHIKTYREILPDHPFRFSIKECGGDEELCKLLSVGLLAVRKSNFEQWYRSERSKSNWPSQHSSSKPRIGRPTKYSQILRSEILLFASKVDRGKIKISTLHRWLINNGNYDVPSQDTLTRIVDEIYSETGKPGLYRPKRKRRASKHRTTP